MYIEKKIAVVFSSQEKVDINKWVKSVQSAEGFNKTSFTNHYMLDVFLKAVISTGEVVSEERHVKVLRIMLRVNNKFHPAPVIEKLINKLSDV